MFSICCGLLSRSLKVDSDTSAGKGLERRSDSMDALRRGNEGSRQREEAICIVS
jgi:hypothetical protein